MRLGKRARNKPALSAASVEYSPRNYLDGQRRPAKLVCRPISIPLGCDSTPLFP